MLYLRTLLLLILLMLVQGCTGSNGVLDYADDSAPYVNYLPVGIPLVMGGHGTSVPLTQEVSLTAKHVAQLDYSKVIAYHPECDLALIEQDNTGKPFATLGTVFASQSVTTVGKNMFGSTLIGSGKYYRDIYLPNHDLFAKCPASLTDAPVQAGMSGGGVYNSNIELVGIISAKAYEVRLADGTVVETDRISLFVPLLFARDWLIEQIDDYYTASPLLDAENKPLLSSAF